MKRLIRRTTRLTSRMSMATMVAMASACGPDSEGGGNEAGTVAEATARDGSGTVAEATARDESSSPQEVTTVIVDVPAYQEHDLNRDGALNRDEFGAWIAGDGVHASWVYEAEGDLDIGPVSRRLFATWDEDGDSLVVESEWSAGVSAWFEPGEPGTFAEWDSDHSAALDADELARALRDRGLFGTIDVDGNTVLDDGELAGWLFGVVDASGDARIVPEEWKAAVDRGWIG